MSDAEEANVHFAGEHQGAGPISFAPDAQPLQLTWSGNLALRLQTQTAEERIEDLLWDMNIFTSLYMRAPAKTVMNIKQTFLFLQSYTKEQTKDF